MKTSLKSRVIFFLISALINGAVILAIPQLSMRQAPVQPAERLNPIWLSDYRPEPVQKNQEHHPKRTLPRETPSEPVPVMRLPQRPETVQRPRMKIELPQLTFEINPELTAGPVVSPPAREPVYASPAPPSPLQAVSSEFEADQVDQAPQIAAKIEPEYPYRARRRGITGYVKARFLVTADGGVEKPAIVEAAPEGVFEKSVLEAIKGWRFIPGYHQGKPVSVWVVLPIRFKIGQEGVSFQ